MPDYIEDQQFSGETLNLSPDQYYEDCVFEGCSFAEATGEGVRFVDCEFNRCDLSNMDLTGVDFSCCQFSHCKMLGLMWPLAKRAERLSFSFCTLTLASFAQLDCQGIRFKDCQLREVDFGDANLRAVDFAGSDLTGAIFDEADLSRADLSRAKNYSIDCRSTTLAGAKFSLPEAVGLLEGLGIELIES